MEYEKWFQVTKEQAVKMGIEEIHYERYQSFGQFAKLSFDNLEKQLLV